MGAAEKSALMLGYSTKLRIMRRKGNDQLDWIGGKGGLHIN